MITLELVSLHATDLVRQNKLGDFLFRISLGKFGINFKYLEGALNYYHKNTHLRKKIKGTLMQI